MKKAIKLFMDIAELCYELDYSPLSEFIASIEQDIKEAEDIDDILVHLDELGVLVSEVDEDEFPEEIVKIEELILKLQELE